MFFLLVASLDHGQQTERAKEHIAACSLQPGAYPSWPERLVLDPCFHCVRNRDEGGQWRPHHLQMLRREAPSSAPETTRHISARDEQARQAYECHPQSNDAPDHHVHIELGLVVGHLAPLALGPQSVVLKKSTKLQNIKTQLDASAMRSSVMTMPAYIITVSFHVAGAVRQTKTVDASILNGESLLHITCGLDQLILDDSPGRGCARAV